MPINHLRYCQLSNTTVGGLHTGNPGRYKSPVSVSNTFTSTDMFLAESMEKDRG